MNFATLASIIGVIGALTFFLQFYKIIKNKSAKDISRPWCIFMIPNAIVWLGYGVEINSFPLIATNIILTIAMVLIFITTFIYK